MEQFKQLLKNLAVAKYREMLAEWDKKNDEDIGYTELRYSGEIDEEFSGNSVGSYQFAVLKEIFEYLQEMEDEIYKSEYKP